MFMTTEQNIGTTNIRDILLIDTDTRLKIIAFRSGSFICVALGKKNRAAPDPVLGSISRHNK
jgi:hypothetical protein